MPQNRSEVIETDATTADDDIGVQGHHHMAPIISPPGQAHISHDTDYPTSRNKDPIAMSPDLVQFIHEGFIILHGSELLWVIVIFFQSPVGRGGDDKMNGSIRNPVEVTGIPQVQLMRGGHICLQVRTLLRYP